MAALKAFVKSHMLVTRDRMFGGATNDVISRLSKSNKRTGSPLLKAYSRPVMLVKISEIPIRTYSGVWTLFTVLGPLHSLTCEIICLPDIDRGNRIARSRSVTAGMLSVDEVLDDCRNNHRCGSEEESARHTLDGSEIDALLAEEGVDELVEDGCRRKVSLRVHIGQEISLTDHDDERNWVQVVDQVIGDIALHGTGLDSQIRSHLVVTQPEKRDENEDRACLESSSDFVNPFY